MVRHYSIPQAVLSSLSIGAILLLSFSLALPSPEPALSGAFEYRDQVFRRGDNSVDEWNKIQGAQFTYLGFDKSNVTDMRYLTYFEEAYSESMKLVDNQIATGYDNEIFNQYFSPDDKTKVRRIFKRMEIMLGSRSAHTVWFPRNDYLEQCSDDKLVCYLATVREDVESTPMKKDDAMLHCCLRQEMGALLTQVDVATFEGKVSLNMENIAANFVHEYVHWGTLSTSILGEESLMQDEETFGDVDVRELRDTDSASAVRNPDNYLWLSLVNWFTKKDPVQGGYKFPTCEEGSPPTVDIATFKPFSTR